jgi:dehydro coenzyme F420 reductase / coenzyme F420-0:L-glutamate ligase / coenzyme F420-1:gamma-L-glutamate ligase
LNLADVVAARRSVRAFTNQPVPLQEIERAVQLAVQAPAPHHSEPWRFLILESPDEKQRLIDAMGAAWRRDLASDGLSTESLEGIVGRSDALLARTPVLVVCCADIRRAHSYRDGRRRRAEWSLFAHSVGAALQTFMLSLAERGIASCWISAPVFCGDDIKSAFELDDRIEPHALVLVGYPSPDYRPRPRNVGDINRFILRLS